MIQVGCGTCVIASVIVEFSRHSDQAWKGWLAKVVLYPRCMISELGRFFTKCETSLIKSPSG